MVIEKLDTLETSLKGILKELTELRGSRGEMESRVEVAQKTARSATDALSGRDGQISKLRQENDRLNKERIEVRDKVERILHRFPGE
jgi:chromosome segregation ATPase